MIYVLIATSLIFVALGFLVTEKNAKYLLSGYNTLSKEERKKFDFKKIHSLFPEIPLIPGDLLSGAWSAANAGARAFSHPVIVPERPAFHHSE